MSDALRPSPFDVIRSLDKRRREHRNVGWVYVLRNPSFREPLLKIGKSSRPPTLRALELGQATAVPEGFQVIYFVHVADRHAAETWVHQQLAHHRKSNSKEFFSCPLAHAIEALEYAAEQLPVVVGRGKHAWTLPQLFEPFQTRCLQCGTNNRVRPLAIPVVAKCRQCGTPLPVAPPPT